MEGLRFTHHEDIDLLSDDEEDDDEDYDTSDGAIASSSSTPPSRSDISMLGGGTSTFASANGTGPTSLIYPHDSVSQKPSRSFTSESTTIDCFAQDTDLFRVVLGRPFTSHCDLYMLPADGAEHIRLDVQHRLLQLAISGLYYPTALVKRALTSSKYYDAPAVLDVGTGSGRWALEMALEFPNAECVGLDLVPPSLMGVDIVPPNCRFEIDDANLSFSHYTDSFNIIHLRAADAGINDFQSFLYNAAQMLRPQGVLLLCSGSPQFYDSNFEKLPVLEEGELGFTWLQRVFSAVYIAYINRGSVSVESAFYWQQWLEENPNYENPETQDVYIPLGPWMQGMDERQVYVSELMRYDIIHVMDAFKPLIVMDEYPADIVDQWVANAQSELRELKIHAFTKWRYTWAVRRDCAWSERLERPLPIDKELIMPEPLKDKGSLSGSDASTAVPKGKASSSKHQILA